MNIVQANLDVGSVTEIILDGKVYSIEVVRACIAAQADAVPVETIKQAARYEEIRSTYVILNPHDYKQLSGALLDFEMDRRLLAKSVDGKLPWERAHPTPPTGSVDTAPASETPNDEWETYARRSGLLNESGIAPDPARTQTAYFAFCAAWNRSFEFNRDFINMNAPVSESINSTKFDDVLHEYVYSVQFKDQASTDKSQNDLVNHINAHTAAQVAAATKESALQGIADFGQLQTALERAEKAEAQVAAEPSMREMELEAARIAYASEFPLNADDEPDVGNIHANIRALKAQVAASKPAEVDDVYMLKREIHNLKRHIEDYCKPAAASGEAIRHECEMAAYTVACKYGHYENEAFKLVDEMFACFTPPATKEVAGSDGAGRLKDHEIRETVNQLCDIASRVPMCQIRERISHLIVPLLKALPTATKEAASQASGLEKGE